MKSLILFVTAIVFVSPALAETATREILAAAMASDHPVIVAARDSTGAIEVESGIDAKVAGADEIVDIGSITKTVTAIAVLHLIEDMGMTTQTTLSQLLPNVPRDKAEITLHQLLTHTSGVIESTGDDEEKLSRSAFLERVLEAPLDSESGAVHSYSNAGYSILAAIIELQSGLDYEGYLIERVIPEGLDPIGYGRVFDENRSMISKRLWLTGYQRLHVAEASWGGSAPGWNLIGNGGLVTTAEGFLSFWAAFLDGEIVGEDYVTAALIPHIDEGEGDTFYGYGLVVEPLDDGGLLFWHDGGNDIFSAEWRHHTSSGTTFFSAGTGGSAFQAMASILKNIRS